MKELSPKPLSKERRAELREQCGSGYDWPVDSDIEDLLRAEQFWREAVKNRPETYRDSDEDGKWIGEEFCFFCGGELASQQVRHAADCPWLLAQPEYSNS